MSNKNGGIRALIRAAVAPAEYLVALFTSIVKPVCSGAYKAAMVLLFLPLEVLLRATPIGALLRKFTHQANILDHLESESIAIGQKGLLAEGEKLMVNGFRYEFAQLVAPREKYPNLYRDVPEDLERSIITDGRIVNGLAPALALAGFGMTGEFVEKAWISATKTATRVGYVLILCGILASAYVSYSAGKMTVGGQAESRQSALPNDSESFAKEYADIWSMEHEAYLRKGIQDAVKVEEKGATVASFMSSLLQSLLMFVILVVASVTFSLATARLIWIGRFRRLVHDAADASVDGLRHSWREALQRWRWRLPEREMEEANYVDQVHFATEIDRSPLLEIGTSLGVMEMRGHMLAPKQHQPVRMSVVDLLQHVEVLGGSGEGKSRNFYIPLVKQLLALRKQGYPIAIYATDDKGAIGADILDAAQELRLPPEDILVIGTGPNDYRVDLLGGLEPVEMADMIKSVSKQAGGESGEDFWPEMASDLLLQIAVVLQAAELTDAGIEWATVNDTRVYSLVNILRVASDDAEIIKTIKIVTAALQNKDGQYSRVQAFDNKGLRAAVTYLVKNWIVMVDATKDGIRANARKALRTFAFKVEIARGFADGAGDKLIPASELLSNKVKIINVSQIEHGSAGRLVSIMLKTIMFKLARRAEQLDPIGTKKKLAWWFNPQIDGDMSRYALNVFLADEYQGLVTASRDDGLSDSHFWGIARSAMVAGVLLSQSSSAYRMAVGDKASDYMRRNWRTKIILRTEDTSTIEEVKKLAGKTLRFQSLDWDHMESSVAVRRETGVDADNLQPVKWTDDMDSIPLLSSTGHYAEFVYSEYKNIYDLDERFVRGNLSPDGGNSAQAAAWRQEDRSSGILQHGASESEAVHDEDIMTMGRGRALVYVQRAGGTRVEIVKLPG